MEMRIWFVDAFASRQFGGNPAAVVPLETWLSDELLLKIASENNLSETAYFISSGGSYEIRWFTPMAEVPLCGHATLASAWVLFNRLTPEARTVSFASKSGALNVHRQANRLVLEFPANAVESVAVEGEVVAALGKQPDELYSGYQWLAIYRDEMDVRSITPDFERLVATGVSGVIVSAPGSDCDFVSRFFAPILGVPEDPVTGSAHTRLVPYWAKRLGRKSVFARQVSARGGELWCELDGDRVRIAGEGALYLEGTIHLEQGRTD